MWMDVRSINHPCLCVCVVYECGVRCPGRVSLVLVSGVRAFCVRVQLIGITAVFVRCGVARELRGIY